MLLLLICFQLTYGATNECTVCLFIFVDTQILLGEGLTVAHDLYKVTTREVERVGAKLSGMLGS